MTPRLSQRQTHSFQPHTPAGLRAAGTWHLTFTETAPFITAQTTATGPALGYELVDGVEDISIWSMVEKTASDILSFWPCLL